MDAHAHRDIDLDYPQVPSNMFLGRLLRTRPPTGASSKPYEFTNRGHRRRQRISFGKLQGSARRRGPPTGATSKTYEFTSRGHRRRQILNFDMN